MGKNSQHKNAIRRKNMATQELGKIGLKLQDDLISIGFIFNHLAISHLTYMGINSITKLKGMLE